jgi:MFS transporter, YNFM family, putative membrane transport protein
VAHPTRIARHAPAFRRTTLALFAAGFSTFALMYCVQPLLPLFVEEFHVTAATSSLAISLTTGFLASALLVTGALSEGWGRKRVMVTSLLLGALLTSLTALVPTWTMLLLVRAAIGVVFAGLPAIAMAYVGEELEPEAVGLAMGIYVGGTAVGGMAGRIFTTLVADQSSWRSAVAVTGGLGFVAAAVVWTALPRSAHFQARPVTFALLVRAYGQQLRDPVLALLFAQGFIFMGAFIAVFNYIGFRLLAPPYSLSAAQIGSVFLLYVIGLVSSPWAGALAHRFGRGRTLGLNLAIMLLGLALTLAAPLVAIGLGMALLSFGFFAAHSVTSSWIGARADARKAQASSLYLFFYYLGASVIGAITGLFFERFSWNGVGTFLMLLMLIALAIARQLSHHEPAKSDVGRVLLDPARGSM